MKNLLLMIALFLSGVIANAATYYVSPTGSDSNPGTISAPFATLSKLNSVMAAGDLAYLRGGTYRSTGGNGAGVHFLMQNLNGTSANPIKIWSYPGEVPVFNLDNITPSVSYPYASAIINCNYVHLKGKMIFKNLKQVVGGAGISRGMNVHGSNNITIENVEIFNMGGCGFILEDASNNLFLNCDSHHNGDPLSDGGSDAWDNSDGFSCSSNSSLPANTSTNNTFKYCRAWLNSDDGWDLFGTNGVFTFEGCQAFWNGTKPWQNSSNVNESTMTVWSATSPYLLGGAGIGIKLGPQRTATTQTIHFLNNCISFENGAMGFSSNAIGALTGVNQIWNSVAYKNGNDGFSFGVGYSAGTSQKFKNNWSWSNNQKSSGADWVYDGNNSTGISNNYWNTTYGSVNYGNLRGSVTVTAADFQSVTSTGVDGARQADGTLPALGFLKLATSSDMVNAGINVGLAFLSSAPDLGAFESGGTTPVNTPPTANAGADQTITLPTNAVSLTGSGTDVGGSITAYAWTKTSGPTGGTITTSNAATTTVTGLTQGTYQFQLQVTDNSGSTATDVVQVVVNAATVNTPPTANAGADKAITLPTNTSSLSGSGTDANGSIASYAWTKVSGPTSGTITTPAAATTTLSSLAQGVYKFELKVTDNAGAIGRDTMQLTVNAATTGNTPPVANAGADKTIVLPTNSVSLTGTGTDANGTIASYAWTKVSGPTSGTITTPAAATTTVTALTQGVYKFALKVTDNGGASASDTMQVTVNAATTTPVGKTIRVNIYNSTTYSNTAWNNWKPYVIFNTGLSSSKFKYTDGTASTVTASFNKQTSIVDNGSAYQPGATMCPSEVLRYASAYAGNRTLSIKGLNPAKQYTVEFYGSSTVSGNQTGYAIGGVSKVISTYNNKSTAAKFYNIKSNSSGVVTVTLTTAGSLNYVNGFTIIEQTSTVAGAREIVSDGKEDDAEVASEVTTESSVSVFPLPFTTSFTVNVHGEATGIYKLNLVDESGKTVWKKEVNKTSASSINETIYMGNLPSGAYILQTIDPDQKKSAQTIIKN